MIFSNIRIFAFLQKLCLSPPFFSSDHEIFFVFIYRFMYLCITNALSFFIRRNFRLDESNFWLINYIHKIFLVLVCIISLTLSRFAIRWFRNSSKITRDGNHLSISLHYVILSLSRSTIIGKVIGHMRSREYDCEFPFGIVSTSVEELQTAPVCICVRN